MAQPSPDPSPACGQRGEQERGQAVAQQDTIGVRHAAARLGGAEHHLRMLPDRLADRPGEIDAGLELDGSHALMRQALELRLDRLAPDQDDQLLAAFVPGHAGAERRRQDRAANACLHIGRDRAAADGRAAFQRQLQQEEAREFARIDLDGRSIGHEVHRIVGLERGVVPGVK